LILWMSLVLAFTVVLIMLIWLVTRGQAIPRHSPEECARLREQLIASGVSPRVAEYVAQGDRLGAVKAYREETGQGLKEAVRYIDQLLKQAL
jgi:ribosomal protein L7/L12